MRFIGTVVGLILVALAVWPAAGASNDLALATFPPAGRLDYKIVRDGDDIGTQSVEFIRNGDRLTVRTHANIIVTVLGIPHLPLHARGREAVAERQARRLQIEKQRRRRTARCRSQARRRSAARHL